MDDVLSGLIAAPRATPILPTSLWLQLSSVPSHRWSSSTLNANSPFSSSVSRALLFPSPLSLFLSFPRPPCALSPSVSLSPPHLASSPADGGGVGGALLAVALLPLLSLSSLSSSTLSLSSASPPAVPSPSLSASPLPTPPPPPSSSSSSPPHPAGVKRRETGLKHMVAGSVAGMAAKTILQPLDLIKVRLQVQDGKGANEYRGVVNAVQRIVAEEGFLGLYRGLTPNLMAAGVSWSAAHPPHRHAHAFSCCQPRVRPAHLCFSLLSYPPVPLVVCAVRCVVCVWCRGTYFFSYNQFKDFFKRRVLSHLPAPADPSAPPIHVQLGPLTHLACAAASGALATTLTNPIVMVKTRLQLQGKEIMDAAAAASPSPSSSSSLHRARPYRGMVDAFTRIMSEEGPLSLYRGLGPSLVLVSNGSLQFMAYEELKELCIRHLVQREEELRSHHYFFMGGLAKIFSATVTYPFAVTRSRLFARGGPAQHSALQAAANSALPAPAVAAAGTAATSIPAVSSPPPSSPPARVRERDSKY